MRRGVRVPASTANIGPGYDSFGLALALYNDFEAELADYFSRLEQEASSPEFLTEFRRVLGSETLRAINDPATPAEQLKELRAKFLGEPVRQDFKASLEDRLARLQGRVVDMFYFPIIQTHWPEWSPFRPGESFIFFRPVFNVADSAITCGVISILIWQKKMFRDFK